MTEIHRKYVEAPKSVNPNLSPDVQLIPIHVASLFPGCEVPCSIVFQGSLDQDRLIEALKMTAAIWPVITGRVITIDKPDDQQLSNRAIKLTSSPIPFETHSIEATRPFPGDEVIGEECEDHICRLGDPLPAEPNSDTPMLTVRLTTLLPAKHDVLCVNISHALGDAGTLHRIVTHLSYFYVNGMEAKIPENEYPSFAPHLELPEYPPDENVLYQARKIPQLKLLSKAERKPIRERNQQLYDNINLKLSADEIREIKKEIGARVGDLYHFSDQDALTGWWIHLLERISGPINQATYVIDYRRMPGPFPPNIKTLCANGVSFYRFEIPTTEMDDPIARSADIARAIRIELNALYADKQKMADWLSGTCRLLELGSQLEDHGNFLPSPEGGVYINSHLRTDWRIPFGFDKDKVYFYTPGIAVPGMARIYQANPPYCPDGRGDYATGDIEIYFPVLKEGGKAKLIELMKGERERWGKDFE